MVSNIKYNLNNWVDGMKIHKDHFVNSENALIDMIRDSISVNTDPLSFGLLEPAPGDKRSLSLIIQRSATDTFKINLSACRAITAGGSRIEVLPQFDSEVVGNEKIDKLVNISDRSNTQSNIYFVVLSVDSFSRRPFGLPSQTESPPRHPSSKPAYSLSIIAAKDISFKEFGNFSFPVARLINKGGNIVEDEMYIPPCASILGHPALIQIFNSVSGYVSHIQQSSNIIVQKVVAKSQNTSLALNIKHLAEKNLQHISANLFGFRTIMPYKPPVYTVQIIVQLATFVKMGLTGIPEKEKEELLGYFKEWNDMTAGAFEDMLNAVIDTEYDHYNIYEKFVPLEYFLKKWSELLQKISELEPIGRRREKDLIMRELVVEDNSKNKRKGFTLLD